MGCRGAGPHSLDPAANLVPSRKLHVLSPLVRALLFTAGAVERQKMFAGSMCCVDLDGSIALYHGLARAREDRPSATAASCRCLHHRRSQTAVEFLHELPGAPIRHT